MGGGFISRADSLRTINSSRIFFPQAPNPSQSKRGPPVSPQTAYWVGLGPKLWGPVPLSPASLEVCCEAAPAWLAKSPTFAAMGAPVISGSGVREGEYESRATQVAWVSFWLRPFKPTANSALLAL